METGDRPTIFFIDNASYDKLDKALGEDVIYVEIEDSKTGQLTEGIVLTSLETEVVFSTSRRSDLN